MDPTTLPRGGSGALGGLLHRDRTVAGPGFSRWMVPPAALCVHLCIGQAYAFSVFNLPMTRLIGITKSAPDDWKLTELGWIFSIASSSWASPPRLRPLGGGRRAAPGDVHRRRCAGAAASWSPRWGLHAQYLAGLSRLRGARRNRPWPRLYLAGLDADQMVSRPARHGDRHGDHGLRWRRVHRLAAVGVADAAILHTRPSRRRRNIHRAGPGVFLLHDGRRGDRAAAAARLGAGGLCGASAGDRS